MNELEEATRSNLVLLSSGFAHGGGTGCGPAASTKQKGPTATVERCVTGLQGYSQHGNSACVKTRQAAADTGLNSSSSTKKNRTSLLSVLTRTACARSEKARAHLTQQKKRGNQELQT